MAVVRCARHHLPYNDQNPRGCPACDAERRGDAAEGTIMRQLARASRAVPPPEVPDTGGDRPRSGRESWPPPVTAPPRVPARTLRLPEKTRRWIATHTTAVGGGVAVAVGLFLLWVILQPEFVEGFEPPLPDPTSLPTPVDVHIPIEGVFARLGPQAPGLNPDSPDLARYTFGNAAVDALNGVVYAVTLTGADRTWKGLRPGVDEETARGMLALLGGARERRGPAPRPPATLRGYQVYMTPDDRPRRTLAAEVRPPNGCYDVVVTLVPRIIGRLTPAEGNVVAVARRGQVYAWAVDRVRAVSRALPGPYAESPACTATPPLP